MWGEPLDKGAFFLAKPTGSRTREPPESDPVVTTPGRHYVSLNQSVNITFDYRARTLVTIQVLMNDAQHSDMASAPRSGQTGVVVHNAGIKNHKTRYRVIVTDKGGRSDSATTELCVREYLPSKNK